MHKATSTPTVSNPISSIPNESYYTVSLGKQAGQMSLIIKYQADSRQWRFVDISAGITFLINPDTNSINFPQQAHDKAIELFSNELQKFVSQRFYHGCEKDSHTTITLEQPKLIGEPPMENTNANNLPQVFTFESDKQIRTIKKDDDIIFVAKDVAVALEYPESSIQQINNLISHVPNEWKGHNPVMTLGGIQTMQCLTEQGLNFFVFRSDKPKALPFQMWLAGEVLPSIRKTGSYSVNSGIDPTTESLIRLEERLVMRFEQILSNLQPKKTKRIKSKINTQPDTETTYNQNLDKLEAAIKWAAKNGHPFTHKRLHGIYENRNRLSKELQHLGRKQLDSMTQQLLDSGRIIKCRLAMGTGRQQWLDIPTGNFGQGNGIISK